MSNLKGTSMFVLDPYTPSRAIADCYRVGQNLLRTKLKPLGIEAGQADCLLIVSQNPGLTQTALNEKLFISQPATARMVRSLCEKGLLVRERDENDNRVWHVHLGPKAKPLEKELQSAFKELVSEHNEALEPAEQAEFQRLLTKTLGHLVEINAHSA